MPSVLSNAPFRSLRPDNSCGREAKTAPQAKPTKSFANLSNGLTNGSARSGSVDSVTDKVNGHAKGHSDGHTNGYTNGHSHDKETSHDDTFLRLEEPQQDILLLHGPRQKYSLAKAQDIPTLKDDREILVQVLAIGLNPVDWKGADYDFGQPSYVRI